MDHDKGSAPGSVAVIGAGYVGLVTAACLARLGNSVRCFDQDRDRIEALRAGEMPFAEPGLAELVKDGVDAGRLAFVTGLAAACRQAAAVVVAVGTDDLVVDDVGRPDLSTGDFTVVSHAHLGSGREEGKGESDREEVFHAETLRAPAPAGNRFSAYDRPMTADAPKGRLPARSRAEGSPSCCAASRRSPPTGSSFRCPTRWERLPFSSRERNSNDPRET